MIRHTVALLLASALVPLSPSTASPSGAVPIVEIADGALAGSPIGGGGAVQGHSLCRRADRFAALAGPAWQKVGGASAHMRFATALPHDAGIGHRLRGELCDPYRQNLPAR